MVPRSFPKTTMPWTCKISFPKEHKLHTLFPDEGRSQVVQVWLQRQREMACLVQDSDFLRRSLSPLHSHHIEFKVSSVST